MQRHLIVCCFVFALALLTPCASGLVNGKAPEADDKRFDAVAAFSRTTWLIENDRDKQVHNWFGGAVLIAPDVVLFARHLLPAQNRDNVPKNAFMVRFRRHSDGTLGSRAAGPNSYHQVPIARVISASRADLAFGILAKPVNHIEPVRVHLDDAPLQAQDCFLAGWGSESPWRGVPKPRVGLKVGKNKVESRSGAVRILSYKTEMRENDAGQRRSYIVDENAVPNMHDSGGSIFKLDAEGNPVLCGIISTYTGGSYLPAANSADFPIEAAMQGGRALVDAIAEAKRVQP
jgi:hypothetical protein